MKTKIILLSAIGILSGLLSAEQNKAQDPATKPEAPSAKQMTTERCLICHGDTLPGQGRLAPPFMMVKQHYQSLNKKKFVRTVMAWVKKPSLKKSRMPGAIRHFALMPPLAYPDDELKMIVEYVYRTDFPMPGHGGKGGGGQGCDDDEATAEPEPGKAGGKGKGRRRNANKRARKNSKK